MSGYVERRLVLHPSSALGLTVWLKGVGYLDADEIADLAEELRGAAEIRRQLPKSSRRRVTPATEHLHSTEEDA